MKNTLADLNNYLFEQIERLNDDEQGSEQFEQDLKRAEAVTKIAKTIIDSANVSLSAKKHFDEYGSNAVIEVPLLGIYGDEKKN